MRALLVLSATLFPAVALAQWQTNFIENPSVEEDANRDGLPMAGMATHSNLPPVCSGMPRCAHSGTYSLRISDSPIQPDASGTKPQAVGCQPPRSL